MRLRSAARARKNRPMPQQAQPHSTQYSGPFVTARRLATRHTGQGDPAVSLDSFRRATDELEDPMGAPYLNTPAAFKRKIRSAAPAIDTR